MSNVNENDERSFLEQAHLVVAGIRVFMHREAKPPAVEELAAFLKTTPELIYHMANRLEKEGIIRSVRTSFETKLYLRDPSKLRDLPEDAIPALDEEMRKKLKQKKAEQEKLGAALSADVIKRRQAQRMAELEKKMKEGLGKPRTPWKDG
jgi:DNA-binding MarR family transcriptional regulator